MQSEKFHTKPSESDMTLTQKGMDFTKDYNVLMDTYTLLFYNHGQGSITHNYRTFKRSNKSFKATWPDQGRLANYLRVYHHYH